jgi:hypothetical protein
VLGEAKAVGLAPGLRVADRSAVLEFGLIVALASAGVVAYVTYRWVRPRYSAGAAVAFAAEHVQRLGAQRGWRVCPGGVEGDLPALGARVALLVAPESPDFEVGSTMLVLRGRASETSFAVWPRDPPDEIVDTWGPEVATHDVVFDARFAVLSRAQGAAVAGALTADARSALLALEVPIVLSDPASLRIVFPGAPDDATLDRAVEALVALLPATQPVGTAYR